MNSSLRQAHSIILWNVCGIRTKMYDILDLISVHRPMLMALQEIKVPQATKFNILLYTSVRKGEHFISFSFHTDLCSQLYDL